MEDIEDKLREYESFVNTQIESYKENEGGEIEIKENMKMRPFGMHG